jgi:hypothetical protein
LEFNIISVYPNPFNPVTTIEYTLKTFSEFEINLYDLLGRQIQQLVFDAKPQGNYSIRFDGSHLASGTYIIGLRTKKSYSASKAILIK